MEAYTSFAQVYDMFMDNVSYDEWADYIEARLKEHGIVEGTILDLGCGTGKITRIMAEKGYDMIGVDNAMEMLDIACSIGPESILYLMQDMRELELYGAVKAVYSTCDCLNYILDEDELFDVFSGVKKYLEEDGVFIFDMNTPYKYMELLGENTFAENRDEGSFIWENYFDEEEQINEYDLTLFIAEDTDNGRLYRKYEETHYQRSYSPDVIMSLLEKAGFKVEALFEGYTMNSLATESDRMTVIATVNNKEKDRIGDRYVRLYSSRDSSRQQHPRICDYIKGDGGGSKNAS